MNNISSFEDFIKAKNMLLLSLGDRSSVYMKAMMKWFRMEVSKLEFDIEVRKFLTLEQLKMHNHLYTKLYIFFTDLEFGPPSPSLSTHKSSSYQTNKRKRQHSSSFQMVSLTDYASVKKKRKTSHHENPPDEMVKYYTNEICILDESSLFGRLTYAAWENDLDGAYLECAKVIFYAVQQLLKNVITAILTERSGYKVKGRFIYEIGLPVPNPWLRCAKNESEIFPRRLALKKDILEKTFGPECNSEPHLRDQLERNILHNYTKANSKSVMDFNKRLLFPPIRDQIERSILYNLSKPNIRTSSVFYKKPVSVPEMINALRINRSVIQSESIYLSCMERLIAANVHPGAND